MKTKKQHTEENPVNFEDTVKRLEQIVETLERGGVALEQAMAMYEEGIQLSKRCLETLQNAEVKLRRLSKDVNGAFAMTDEENNG